MGSNNYVLSMTTTNYTAGGLSSNTLYSFTVVAMNAGGVSGSSAVVSTPPAAPASLNAYPGNAQITLSWSASIGATNYVILRGTSSGNETVVAGTATNTTYTDTGLLNGTNYYYVVYAVSTGGNSINSPEASATPFAGPPPIYWINALTSSAQDWNVNSNWSNGSAFPNATQATAIVNSPISAAQTINLNQSITVGNLSIGATGGAFNVTGNGGSLTFDDTPGLAWLTQLASSKGDTISAPVTLNSDLNISNLSANAHTLAGPISGTNGITILGPGVVALSGTNTFNGGLMVAGGTLEIDNQYSAGNNAIQLTGGGTLNENTISFTNAIINSASNTWTISGSGNVSPAATLTGNGVISLNITCSGVCTPGGDWSQFAGTIAWAPGNGAQCRLYGTTGSSNAVWNLGNNTASLYNRNGAITINLGALSGGSLTTISGASATPYASTYSIGALNLDSTFNGRVSDGQGTTAINKVGTGVLMLTGTNNTYSGGTAVNGGTLLVNNLTGTGVGSGAVSVNSGGTLGGNGIIAGAVTVNSGGKLTPGNNAIGTLTLGNALTLAAGSAAVFGVSHSPLTNDLVQVTGLLKFGGTLVVTNVGTNALVAGDHFTLATATSYSGAFTNLNLPALNAGLAWNTNQISTNGSLSVVSIVPPSINQTRLAGNNIILTGSGGTPGGNYYLLTTTNLTLPVTQWTRLATNLFDGSGNFNCTNAVNLGWSQTFYQLQSQ